MSLDSLQNSSSLNGSEDSLDGGVSLSPTVQFWVLLVFSIPSIICSLYVLWLLFSNPEFRRSLNYRVIIVQLIGVLIFLLTNVPLYLSYLRLGYVWPQSPAICQFGWFVGDGFIDTMTILVAWGSLERHIFIFHDGLTLTSRKRFFAHYLPVTLIVAYCPFYYLVVQAVPPCENIYDYTTSWCSSSCLYENRALVMYDVIFNDVLATILVAVFSISLIIRVLYHHRARFNRPIRWRQHRKIIIIFLSISAIYLFFNLPIIMLKFLDLCGIYGDILERLEPYFNFLNYFVFILYPFICLGTMSKRFCNQRRQRVVGPTALAMLNRQVIQKQS
jgi:hypothetical protein